MNANAERALEAAAADVLVTADPFTVGWLTGFAADALWGPAPSPCRRSPVVTADGVTLLCSSDEAPGVDPARATTLPYEGFTHRPARPGARTRSQLLAGLGLRGRVAVEAHALSMAAAAVLPEPARRRHGAARPARRQDAPTSWRRCAGRSRSATPDRRRRARPCRAGVTELTAWNAIAGAMEAAAGERLPLLCDLVSGPAHRRGRRVSRRSRDRARATS